MMAKEDAKLVATPLRLLSLTVPALSVNLIQFSESSFNSAAHGPAAGYRSEMDFGGSAERKQDEEVKHPLVGKQSRKGLHQNSNRSLFSLGDYVYISLGILIFAALFLFSGLKMIDVRKDVIEGEVYIQGLRRGWLMGMPQDLSDTQWRTLRNFFPLLLFGLTIHVFLSWVFCQCEHYVRGSHTLFYMVSNLGFLFFLHGRDIFWILSIGLICFWIGKTFRTSIFNPILTWSLCLLMKFLSDYYKGFSSLNSIFWPPAISYRGVYGWHIQFNLCILRLISFNMDTYWRLKRSKGEGEDDSIPLPELGSSVHSSGGDVPPIAADAPPPPAPAPPPGDGLAEFISYVYYVPLHIAGPVCCYDDWRRQARAPARRVPVREALWLLVRVVGYVLLLEVGGARLLAVVVTTRAAAAFAAALRVG